MKSLKPAPSQSSDHTEAGLSSVLMWGVGCAEQAELRDSKEPCSTVCVGPQGQFQFGPNCGEQTKVFTRENSKEGRQEILCSCCWHSFRAVTTNSGAGPALLSQVPASCKQSFAKSHRLGGVCRQPGWATQTGLYFCLKWRRKWTKFHTLQSIFQKRWNQLLFRS